MLLDKSTLLNLVSNCRFCFLASCLIFGRYWLISLCKFVANHFRRLRKARLKLSRKRWFFGFKNSINSSYSSSSSCSSSPSRLRLHRNWRVVNRYTNNSSISFTPRILNTSPKICSACLYPTLRAIWFMQSLWLPWRCISIGPFWEVSLNDLTLWFWLIHLSLAVTPRSRVRGDWSILKSILRARLSLVMSPKFCREFVLLFLSPHMNRRFRHFIDEILIFWRGVI